MYTTINFRTKKALKESVAKGEQVTVFQPGGWAGATNGDITLEGPHYPEPHRWYARAEIKDSVIVRIRP